MNINKILTIYIKELKELKRDRVSRIMVFIMPITILIVFGYGMALDVEHIPFVTVDEDNTLLSRELISKFVENKRYYSYKGDVENTKEAIDLIDKGKVRTAIVIPKGFEENLKKNRKSDIQIIEDGIFPYRASVSRSYSQVIATKYNYEIIESKGFGFIPIELKVRYWFNEQMSQKNITTSGVLAIALFLGPAILSSLLVVKEKERGSIYNIYTSSIRKSDFLLAKQLFAMSIFSLNFIILFLLTIFLFNVPFKGNFILFLVSSFCYLSVSTSIGIFISTFVASQVTAVVGTAITCIIPAFLYSGYIAPVSSMTNEAYIIAHLFPTYYYLNTVKMFYLKGVDFLQFFVNCLILLSFYVLFISLSILKFRKYEK